MSQEAELDIDYIEKLETGIPGFDFLAEGGLPKGRATLVSGTAGSSKTVFASQFLVEGIKRGENGVFVTFEEPPKAIRRNMSGFGWKIREWEENRQWAFVDASPQPGERPMVTGEYDLGALIARIEYAIRKYSAKRVSLDSLGAIFSHLADSAQVRNDLFRLASALRELGVTAIMTAERTQEYGEISRYGVEEFVADNVVILRNVLNDEKRRRTIEILKYRGTNHQKGEYPFTIIPGQGMVIIPLSAIELEQHSSNIRITSGSDQLDKMCGGGFFRDSIILVSGATGTGKTLMVTEFMAGGVQNNERCLVFAFEESREQLFRNATGWGVDFQKMEKEGKLKVVCRYPETTGLENHLINMKQTIKEFKPNRVAVDSLSALERVSNLKGFREFIIGLTSFIKQQEIGGLFTSTTPTLLGGSSITEAHISTITDSIILLRYVEMYGEMRRGITVLKMRGSMHDKDIREFTIDHNGMHIGHPFRNVTGILAGTPMYTTQNEVERLSNLFDE
ncbi:MAG: circadian clock protein KaiC [Cyanobacteria bacterium]|nr:circadian clock protein KaiC [Cyanobacteria bacterium CG_2015-16_32_12]NCO79021.1 circadian clock protein KaiC [Cyanobacteria bacterium CG_2015-22_32_23]NCQ05641.1 circadian clock protein KaiC [Cyanobacteria bacterium CG_2015-09_32_10]NCQ40492.1 circadian clock protein KaiC [Cyanobacteria bacterium CG_2015-04_32_10]NCS83868.1 circadian clock protein KaiC [Cyanobacteria bacterium CG_2015-02_32_10]